MSKVSKEKKESAVLVVRLDLSDHQDLPANADLLETADSPEPTANRDPREKLADVVVPVLRDPREALVIQEEPESLVFQELAVLLASLDPRDAKVSSDPLDLQEKTADPALLEPRDSAVHLDRSVTPESREPTAPPAKRVPRVFPDLPAAVVLPVRTERSDPRVFVDLLEMLVSVESLDNPVPPDSKDCPVFQDRSASQESLARPVCPVRLVPSESLVLVESVVSLVTSVLPVLKVSKESVDFLVCPELMARREPSVKLDLQESLVPRVSRVLLDPEDLLDSLELRVTEVILVFLALRERLVKRDFVV